jgi:hypothetical protein
MWRYDNYLRVSLSGLALPPPQIRGLIGGSLGLFSAIAAFQLLSTL